MENENIAKLYFQTLEKSIAALDPKEQANVFRPCAIGCVEAFVLKEMRRQFEECGRSLDNQYTKYGRTPYFFADIIEKGRIYELGYPRCLCPLVEAGYANAPIHCECSRQSILYVLHDLLPGRDIQVETMHTVLDGSTECRFRVTCS